MLFVRSTFRPQSLRWNVRDGHSCGSNQERRGLDSASGADPSWTSQTSLSMPAKGGCPKNPPHCRCTHRNGGCSRDRKLRGGSGCQPRVSYPHIVGRCGGRACRVALHSHGRTRTAANDLHSDSATNRCATQNDIVEDSVRRDIARRTSCRVRGPSRNRAEPTLFALAHRSGCDARRGYGRCAHAVLLARQPVVRVPGRWQAQEILR